LGGELTVVTEDNRTLHLKTGESIVEVVNKWHYGKNEGNKMAEILVFYAGVQDTPITVTGMPAIDTLTNEMLEFPPYLKATAQLMNQLSTFAISLCGESFSSHD